MQAITLINLCALEYQDAAFSRISKANWLSYLNDAQRAVVLVRPDSNGVTQTFQLVAGTKQSLPSGGIRLLGVERNMGIAGTSPGDTIRFVDKDTQDLVSRSWHTKAAGTVVRDCLYDDKKDPLTFWVSPPVHATTPVYIQAVIAKNPTDVTDADTGAITIPDIYSTALQQWMLYRAYMLATQAVNQFQRAASYQQAFFNLLGVKARVDAFYAAAGIGAYPQPQQQVSR